MSEDVEAPEAGEEQSSILGGAEGESAKEEPGGEEAAKPDDAKAGDHAGDVKAEDKADGEGEDKSGDDEPGELDMSKIEAPEGFEMDEEALKAAEPVFKELGLSQQQAQKLVEFYGERLAAMSETQASAMTETTEKWVSDIKGEWGDKFDENVAIAAKAVEYGGDELREALNLTGAGNHPAVIKFFHQIGRQLSEDGFQGQKPAAAQGDWMKGLYPSMQTTSGGS